MQPAHRSSFTAASSRSIERPLACTVKPSSVTESALTVITVPRAAVDAVSPESRERRRSSCSRTL